MLSFEYVCHQYQPLPATLSGSEHLVRSLAGARAMGTVSASSADGTTSARMFVQDSPRPRRLRGGKRPRERPAPRARYLGRESSRRFREADARTGESSSRGNGKRRRECGRAAKPAKIKRRGVVEDRGEEERTGRGRERSGVNRNDNDYRRSYPGTSFLNDYAVENYYAQ